MVSGQLRLLPLCPGQVMFAVWPWVPGGGFGTLWEARAYPGNRKVPHQGPLTPCCEGGPELCRVDVPEVRIGVCGRKSWGLREGHGVWGSHRDPCVRRWTTQPSRQTGPGRK